MLRINGVTFALLVGIMATQTNANTVLSQNCPQAQPIPGKQIQAGTVTLKNEWPAGFDAKMVFVIPEDINGWEISLTFSNSVSNFQVWRATPSNGQTSGQTFTLINKSWNAQLTAGTTYDLSFLADKSGNTPTVCADLIWNSASTSTSSTTQTTATTTATATATTATTTATTATTTTQAPSTTSSSSSCPPVNYDYNDVLHKSILFYEAQRSGSLPSSNRIPWRGDSALGDGSDVGEDLTGGWYDAGDHVKFGFPMAFSTTLLAWGLIEYENAYVDASELLYMRDSIKWSLDYFIKAHVQANVLYGQVGSGGPDHAYWGRPEDMTMARPAYKIDTSNPGSDLAAETAAAMAAGSIAFSDSDPAYAATLLQHAEQLYQFADQYRAKYSDSITDANSFYSSTNYEDELVWGAAWLYKATQESTYLQKAENYFSQFGTGNTAWGFSWDEKVAGAQLLLYDLTGNSVYKSSIESSLDAWLPGNSVTYTPKGLAWRLQWGPNRYAANTAFLALLAADKGLKTSTYRQFGKDQIDYMLGDSGRSFVVGFGNNPPQRPHHRSSSCPDEPASCSWSDYNSPNPNPQVLNGALVGGPDAQDNYQDARTDFVKNEVACDYNAGFQSAVAALRANELSSCQNTRK